MSEERSSRPRGQNDPGWNDPPKLQFNSIQSGSKTRLNLNKRVAFPLQGAGSGTSKPTAIVHPSHPPVSTLPVAIVPPMARSIPAPVPAPATESTQSRLGAAGGSDGNNLSDSERQLCLDTFDSFVPCVQAGINIRPDEVRRRINLMNQMWLSGTLAPSVQRKIQCISNALAERNFDEAIEVHRTLVVEHSSICVAWGAALRQIILTIQPANAETSPGNQGEEEAMQVIATVASNEEDSLGRQSEENNSESLQSPVQHI